MIDISTGKQMGGDGRIGDILSSGIAPAIVRGDAALQGSANGGVARGMMRNVGGGMTARFGGGGLSAKSYVQDGLIALYDGIENAGDNKHNDLATTWVDLIGGNNLLVHAPSWQSNCFDFNNAYISQRVAGEIIYSQDKFTNLKTGSRSMELVYASYLNYPNLHTIAGFPADGNNNETMGIVCPYSVSWSDSRFGPAFRLNRKEFTASKNNLGYQIDWSKAHHFCVSTNNNQVVSILDDSVLHRIDNGSSWDIYDRLFLEM